MHHYTIEKFYKPFHNSMDGTRVIRAMELYENEYLVGESFPVLKWVSPF